MLHSDISVTLVLVFTSFYIFGGGLQCVFVPASISTPINLPSFQTCSPIPDDGESRSCCIILKFETVLTVYCLRKGVHQLHNLYDQDHQSNSNQNMIGSPTMARPITYNKGTLCVMKFGSSEMCALV